ncbi:uncharacterized protein LOC117625504 [Prunus dulcis]|nr:uncharacterized protein LOC117625504 [Prunus dulcis]
MRSSPLAAFISLYQLGPQPSGRRSLPPSLLLIAVTKAPAPPQAGTEPPEDSREESITSQAEPMEDLELISLYDDIPDRQVRICTSISPELRSDLVAFLRLNSEVFAWSYNDMPGISPDIISHRLSVNPAVRPVRQKRRAYDPERYEAMRAEVDRLSSIRFIREVAYPTWLANVVMVVDATSGHALLSFMDAYSGYNQIFMHPEDQAHTSFITDRGLYCYRVMPFGLKNAGATYQRLVNHIFAPLIGNTMEVYVDDMLVKSRTADKHILNLSAMFTILKQYKMRLNPTKWRVAALTRFISKATDRCAPFFKALKGTKRNITWTAKCDTAFSELKEYMGRAPLLSTPKHGDILVIYLSVSASAVSSMLIRSKDNAEHPVHYVLQKPETSGRLVEWAIELGEFDIHYKPRPAIRGQAVADFLSEFTEHQASAATQLITEPNLSLSQDQTPSKSTLDLTQPLWTLFVDGSSNAQGCGAGLVLVSPDKVALEYALRFKFQASNNEAEYEALLAGLRLAKEMDAKQIQIFSDSQLVVHQVNQDFTAKDASMTAYLQHARHLLATFHARSIRQVPRSENSHADALARLASALEQGMGRHIHIEFLAQPSTQAPLICTIDHSPTWMDPILQFLQNQTLPANPAEARRVRHRSARYLIINGSLYKRGFSLPYLRCLTPEEGHYVLREIHEGICEGKGQVKYAVVAVDYFTKWAEAEALATIAAARIESFVWQSIVCRFGIPNSIVTDNGRQFDNAKFKQFCSNLKIHLCFASPAHPQSNGQVEAVNKIIKKTLKTKLDKAKGCWPELLPEVLWSYRTTFRTSTGEMPFSLSFGTETVAPVEIGQPTYRISTYDAKANDEQLALNLDFIDELRDQSSMHNVVYKQCITTPESIPALSK